MRIYDFALAPNPRKLRIYLREKGLDIPLVAVDVLNGANRTPEFLATVNPLGGLPVLELDDGSHLTESLAIIEYLEELHPAPPMIGTTPLERARARELERMAEHGVLNSVGAIFQNTSPFFAARVKQSADAAHNARTRLDTVLRVLDQRTGAGPFVCGARPTVADCTLFASIEFATFAGSAIDFATLPNLGRWHAAFRTRPSASA
jgi:glutathione S-transferase